MITSKNLKSIGLDLCGLSTDIKPIDVMNGSSFYEINTDRTFRFDAENKQWIRTGESKYLSYIHITSTPSKVQYFYGDTLDKTGLKIEAVYTDGSKADIFNNIPVGNYIVEFEHDILHDDFLIPSHVYYTENGITRSDEFQLHINPICTSIYVDTLPNKTVYHEGETFDATGMSIIGTLSNGGLMPVTDYCEFTDSALVYSGDGNGSITVTYKNLDEVSEVTTSVPISVLQFESLRISTPPTKTEYEAGDLFDSTGMVVEKVYSDDSTEPASYTYLPQTALAVTDTAITISCTEAGNTKTVQQEIVVNAAAE